MTTQLSTRRYLDSNGSPGPRRLVYRTHNNQSQAIGPAIPDTLPDDQLRHILSDLRWMHPPGRHNRRALITASFTAALTRSTNKAQQTR